MKIRRWAWIAFAFVCLTATTIGLLSKPTDDLSDQLDRYHPKITRELDGTIHFVFPAEVHGVEVLRHLDTVGWNISCSVGCDASLTLRDGRIAQMSYIHFGGNCRLDILPDKRSWFERAWSSLAHRFRP